MVFPPRPKLLPPNLVLVILALAFSHFAAAEERYSAEYYDDGENLHFVDAWEDPFAQPDPESDFFQTLIIPRSSGGCCGTGQTNGAEGIPGADERLSADDKALDRGESTSSSRGRRFPGVLSTGRRINAEGFIRVFLAQDSGDQFSLFARRAREEPLPTIFFEVEDDNVGCDSPAAERGRSARSRALRQNPAPSTNITGVTYQLTHAGGQDIFVNVAHSTAPCFLSTTCPGGERPTPASCPARLDGN